jgi:mannose-6-phosphate isomerase
MSTWPEICPIRETGVVEREPAVVFATPRRRRRITLRFDFKRCEPGEVRMAIEHAGIRVVDKPWGSFDLRPWSDIRHDSVAIGELWFDRADPDAPDPALLLKLLFTTEPLSIQVHPDDSFAHSIGLANGKTEAWYILSAALGAKVALGLKRQLTAPQLRTSIEDGSIADLVLWRAVVKDDVIDVPAGTIHAIGAGLAIAEIQQRSDATFRMFDYGREREIHIDKAVAVANAGPAERQSGPRRLTGCRTLLAASPYFVLERIELPAKSNWELDAQIETWVFVLDGHARIGPMNAFTGEAIFVESECASIRVGRADLKALLAYPSPAPIAGLLRRHDDDGESAIERDLVQPSIDQQITLRASTSIPEARA